MLFSLLYFLHALVTHSGSKLTLLSSINIFSDITTTLSKQSKNNNFLLSSVLFPLWGLVDQ